MSKNKTIIVLSILFVILNVSVYSVLKVNEEQRVKIALDTHLDKITSYFNMLMYHQSITASSAYESTINKKRVIDILSLVQITTDKDKRAILRQDLYELLKEKYTLLKTKGVLQYHFVLPNNKVFLRLHKPSKFGDDLTDIRYSFKYTNSTHKESHGFEQGRTSHGFRNVFPIFDKNKKYLAAIEISFSSDNIQDQLTTIGSMHTHFLVNKHIFDEKAWRRDDLVVNYQQSAENHDYLMSMTAGHSKEVCIDNNTLKLKSILEKIDKNIHADKKFALYTIYNDEAVAMSFYPIKNIKDKKTVAWIVSYEKDDFIYITLKSNIYISSIAFILFIILFYFLYRMIMQKTILDTQMFEKNKILFENEKDAWIKEGTSGLNTKLSQNENLVDVCNTSITYLCEHLNVGVGALYVWDDEEDSLHLTGSYAFVQREELSNIFKLGEGTIGQVALQKTPILLKNITRNHMIISTGTTSEAPINTYTFPLMYQEELYGVIELGSTFIFSENELEFFNLADKIIATKILSTIQNKRVKDLLLKSQESNTQLNTQTKELEEANSQMQEQQAQLEEANSQMQEQQAQLEEANSQMEEQQVQLKESEKELITQNKNLEKSKQELNLKANALEESNRYKSEFLANMSHELRTPLNSIILLSTMLGQNKNKNLNVDEIKKAKIINSSGEELLRLINDVLDLSKVEAGRMDLLVTQFDSSEFASKIKDTFEISAKNKNLTLIVEDSYNSTITTDENKLSQVVRNFISNSLKFTAKGTITFSIEDASYNKVKVSVKDTGIGIASDKQKLVFKAFTQADGSTSRKYGGTGLGLSITKELVELMNGKVYLESQENEGSIFSVVIPNLKSEKSLEEPIQSIKVNKFQEPEKLLEEIIDDSQEITLDKRVFLIIEDNKTFALTLKNIINEKGDYALIAPTGEDGLSLAHKYSNIEGILLDLGLPDIDGVDVLKRLKTDIHTRKIPVYIISGRDSDINLDISQAVGFKQKPLSPNDLETIFDDLKKINNKDIQNILIVEDDDIQREIIMEFIANENIKTTGASSVDIAIKEIDKDIYDGVVIDLTLMDKSGIEVCEYIKTNNLELPIIIYTGKELSVKEENEIHKYTNSIIIKSTNSQNRLLQEVDLFLHRVKTPPKEVQKKVSVTDIDFKNKKIMVVDDDMRNTFALVEILEERNAQVLTASNGQEALEILDENKDISVILMDIMMPVMNGYEAIKRIRANSEIKTIPIIAVTAKSMPQDKEKSIAVGANDCLTKPLNLDTFVGVLKSWIK